MQRYHLTWDLDIVFSNLLSASRNKSVQCSPLRSGSRYCIFQPNFLSVTFLKQRYEVVHWALDLDIAFSKPDLLQPLQCASFAITQIFVL